MLNGIYEINETYIDTTHKKSMVGH